MKSAPHGAAPHGAAPEGVVVRPQLERDDPEVVTLWKIVDPDFPALPVDEYRSMLEQLPADVRHARIVAEHDGVIVGSAHLLQKFWTESAHSYDMGVSIHPDHRERGIGTALYQSLFPLTHEWGSQRLFADVREHQPRSRQFAEKHGFEPTGHETRNSCLTVAEATTDGYEDLEERLRDQSISIRTLAELGPEDEQVLRKIHSVDMETARDEPSSEAYSMPFDRWREFLKSPGQSPEATWVAVHSDEFIGLTKLRRQGPNAAWHQGMGTLRQYRGKGVARLLKFKTIEFARLNGIEYLYTGNDINNPRMYAINIRLGYQPMPASIEMRREVVTG